MLHPVISLQPHESRCKHDLDFQGTAHFLSGPDGFPTPLYSAVLYSLVLLICLNGSIQVYGDMVSPLLLFYLLAEEVIYFDQQSFL